MKKHLITLTVNAWVEAESQDAAESIFENMEIKCTDLDSKKEIESDLVDWEWKSES